MLSANEHDPQTMGSTHSATIGIDPLLLNHTERVHTAIFRPPVESEEGRNPQLPVASTSSVATDSPQTRSRKGRRRECTSIYETPNSIQLKSGQHEGLEPHAYQEYILPIIEMRKELQESARMEAQTQTWMFPLSNPGLQQDVLAEGCHGFTLTSNENGKARLQAQVR
ncbi:hypothetical protein B0J17DRAFT_705078 [Rhizoctonia solani]|nr:hypothetical protein B0J17DRAFT_705078 [Rhizoctonia solani]